MLSVGIFRLPLPPDLMIFLPSAASMATHCLFFYLLLVIYLINSFIQNWKYGCHRLFLNCVGKKSHLKTLHPSTMTKFTPKLQPLMWLVLVGAVLRLKRVVRMGPCLSYFLLWQNQTKPAKAMYIKRIYLTHSPRVQLQDFEAICQVTYTVRKQRMMAIHHAQLAFSFFMQSVT